MRLETKSGSIEWMNIGEKEVEDWGLRVLEGNALLVRIGDISAVAPWKEFS